MGCQGTCESPTGRRIVTVLRCRDIFLEDPTVELRLRLLTYELPHQSYLDFGYSSLWHCLQLHWLTGMSCSTLEYLIHHVLF